VSVFSRLSPRLQQAIVARLGWSSLRPVQELAGEALLAGANAVVLAPTAGGKTEASIFPTLSLLLDNPAEGVGALYIAPIKALLNNQADRLGLYTEMVGLRRFVWHGDTTSHERRSFLREPAELLMTTPESLEVMLVSEKIDTRKLFGDLRIVIIDEIHALAGTDRGAHLLSVLERIARVSCHDVQRVGLSATVGNPAAISEVAAGDLAAARDDRGPAQAAGAAPAARSPPSGARRPRARRVEGGAGRQEPVLLSVAVGDGGGRRAHAAGRDGGVCAPQRRVARGARARRGALPPRHRCLHRLHLDARAGHRRRRPRSRAAARGAGHGVSSFLQRMGRTGRRAGQVANTTFFCETGAGVVQAIALVELAKAGWVEPVELSDRCWPVLVHQLLAMALAEEGVPPEAAWGHLSQVPDFKGIHRAEFDRLHRVDAARQVAGAARRAAADRAQGRERRFGRRNFMELYAVFSSPQSYSGRDDERASRSARSARDSSIGSGAS
jgi:ATP-dependent Lhr-like helicase